MPRSRRTFRQSAQRRKRVWARDFHSFSVTGITEPDDRTIFRPLADFRAQMGSSLVGVTVGGIHIALSLAFDGVSPPAPAPGVVVAGLITGESVDAQVDGPVSHPHEDWLVWYAAYAGTSQHDGVDTLRTKSMRKMEEVGDDLVLVFEAIGTGSTGTVNGNAVVSTLVLLP